MMSILPSSKNKIQKLQKENKELRREIMLISGWLQTNITELITNIKSLVNYVLFDKTLIFDCSESTDEGKAFVKLIELTKKVNDGALFIEKDMKNLINDLIINFIKNKDFLTNYINKEKQS